MRIPSLVCILVIAVVFTAGCSQGPQQAPPQTTVVPALPPELPTQTPATAASTPVSQAQVSANTVAVKDFAFNPGTITVKAGSIVRWENQDPVPHRIVFIDKDGRDTSVDSNVLSPSQSWSSKFSQPGTYSYYCKIHPAMTGTVIVE
jgi:plastocyanin